LPKLAMQHGQIAILAGCDHGCLTRNHIGPRQLIPADHTA
jgi:hypothetical protein